MAKWAHRDRVWLLSDTTDVQSRFVGFAYNSGKVHCQIVTKVLDPFLTLINEPIRSSRISISDTLSLPAGFDADH